MAIHGHMARNDKSRSGRLAILAVAAFILGLSGVAAARLGIAGHIRHGIEARRPPIEGAGGYAWLTADDSERIRRALALDNDDPVLHEFLAFAIANSHLDPIVAKAHLERSIVLRPVSPYSWAALETNRYLAGAPVAELEKPLMNAALLGPSEPAVQHAVADFGLALWKESGPATRLAVDRTLIAGISRDPNEFMQIAQRRGRLDVACRHFDSSSRQADSKWTITCNRQEATS
jgi:hypothetical protein